MPEFIQTLKEFNSIVWGPWMLGLIMFVGLMLSLRLKGITLLKIAYAFRQLISGRTEQGPGAVPPFSALMMSLSATIGTGNIVGVATAIGLGGPGALFWMWCSALLGMATKYAEAVCAVHFREDKEDGTHVGGPMYYIQNGLAKPWRFLAIAFAFFGAIAAFGIGNTVQSNSVVSALNNSFSIPEALSMAVLMVLVALVILGGVKRLASVAKKLVPFMGGTYVLFGLVVILANISNVPEAVALVVKSAFNPVAAVGGFTGAAVAMAVQFGVARGVFSNEAGLGSAPIAHAAAATDSPVRQGLVAMLGTFIDTLVICSITGIAIVVTGVWSQGLEGPAMSQAAFSSVIPYGDKFVAIALSLFAFTTLLGWSYYGERCSEYLFGEKAIRVFRLLWIIAIPVGILPVFIEGFSLNLLWLVADTLNALMALPNLIALIMLSGLVVKLTKEYFENEKS